MENLISVIVITYNQESTIARTLDSVLMQQCHIPIEIVIGEDCSTDSTLSICRKYAKEHPDKIRLIENVTNKGMIDNYYDCLLECKGKYIADCAGDDFWTDPLKLEKESLIMEKDESITLVHTNWSYYDEETGKTTINKTIPFPAPVTNGNKMLKAIITQTEAPVIHLCTALYRSETIRKAYFENTFLFRNKDFRCEDLQICFTLALSGNIAFIPDSTLNYSWGKPSVSFSVDDKKQFRFVKGVTDLSFYLASQYGIAGNDIDKYFSERIFALYMHAFRSKSKALRDVAIECKKEWNAKPSFKTAAISLVMSGSLLWKTMLYVRKFYVRLKKIAA